MDTEPLRQFGLTENEIKVYLANLELGSATANNLAKRANLPRPTTYDVLTTLKEKGLASHVVKSGVYYFEAANPAKLLNVLKEREEKISKLLPDLLSIQKTVTEKPKIELYEGVEGLKSVIDDLIATNQPILTLSSTKDLLGRLVFFFPNYIKRRVEAKIPIKVITEKTKRTEALLKKQKEEYREMRFVSKELEFPNAIYIYGNKIALLNLNREPLTGIIIENEELNKTFRITFELLWRTLSG
ncbi:hypothetical protein HZC30_04310 [Candidatus Woesearchaeota archaeon]|nr:hypothetical protein [Candidatus Woesearchaeota archaeon]